MSALKYLLVIAGSLIAGWGGGHLVGLGAEWVIGGLGATEHAAMLGFLFCRYGGTIAGAYYAFTLGDRFA